MNIPFSPPDISELEINEVAATPLVVRTKGSAKRKTNWSVKNGKNPDDRAAPAA